MAKAVQTATSLVDSGSRSELRSLLKLLSATSLSNLADGVMLLALPWLATRLTSDPLQITLVGAASRLPWLLFGLPAGVCIDRIDRRRLLILGAGARAAILGVATAFAWSGLLGLPVLVAFTFVWGASEVLFDSTVEAYVPDVVAPDRLVSANGWLRASVLVTNDLLGQPVGGWALLFGPAAPFAVAAVCCAAAALATGKIPPAGTARVKAPSSAPLRAELREAAQCSLRNPLLRSLTGLGLLVNFCYSGMLAIQVLYVQQVLGVGPRGFGSMLAVSALGGIAAGYAAGPLNKRFGTEALLATALAGMGAALFAFGCTSNVVYATALYVATSFCVVIWSVQVTTIRQRAVPSEQLGRVNGIVRLFSWGVSPIGMAAAGVAMEVSEPWLGRGRALRLPYLASGALYCALVPIAVSVWRRGATRDHAPVATRRVPSASPED